jgi:hypothetical protein
LANATVNIGKGKREKAKGKRQKGKDKRQDEGRG